MSTAEQHKRPYVGRFAPTPSGGLHLGSLLTAVASYLDARAQDGRWLLRVDDVDSPRIDATAETSILRTLENHGLGWDGPVMRQSDNGDAYQAAIETLRSHDLLFYCNCSRKHLRQFATYPGTCRRRLQFSPDTATRIRTDDRQWRILDKVQGVYTEQLSDTVGDFVVWRRDKIASYQIAVVVDDHLADVTHVVRGADLLDNLGRQLFLHDALGWTPPTYLHIPIIVDVRDVKLSKHDGASVIDDRFPARNLSVVLQLLGQPVPASGMESASPQEVLDWACEHWDRGLIAQTPSIKTFLCV